MNKKRCINCGCKFLPKKHILNQRYCSKKRCQNARKTNWRRDRLRHNKKYSLSKKEAQYKWKINKSDYWRSDKADASKDNSNAIKAKKTFLKIALPKSILVNLPKSGVIKSDCQVVFRFI